MSRVPLASGRSCGLAASALIVFTSASRSGPLGAVFPVSISSSSTPNE